MTLLNIQWVSQLYLTTQECFQIHIFFPLWKQLISTRFYCIIRFFFSSPQMDLLVLIHCNMHLLSNYGSHHDDVIKWKHFPSYWPFVQGIHQSPVNSPHKGQWRRTLVFSLICVWINGWVNNREAGDLRRYLDHYDVTVMQKPHCVFTFDIFCLFNRFCNYLTSCTHLTMVYLKHKSLFYFDVSHLIVFTILKSTSITTAIRIS